MCAAPECVPRSQLDDHLSCPDRLSSSRMCTEFEHRLEWTGCLVKRTEVTLGSINLEANVKVLLTR